MEPKKSFSGPFYEGERGAAFQAQFTFLVRRFEQLQALDLGPRSQRLSSPTSSSKRTSSSPVSI